MVDRQTFNLRAGSSILPAPTAKRLLISRAAARGRDPAEQPFLGSGGARNGISVRKFWSGPAFGERAP